MFGCETKLKANYAGISKLLRVCFGYNILFASLLVSAWSQAEALDYRASNEGYQLQLQSAHSPQLNKLQQWRATLSTSKESVDFSTLDIRQIRISGGMPAHGHGLPTSPKAVNLEHIAKDKVAFTIQGLKFQMWGDWVVGIKLPQMEQPLVVPFTLAP